MVSKTMETKVKEAIIEVLMVDDEEVTPGASLVDDLGADSLDLVELAIQLEETFDISVDDDMAMQWKTVSDVHKYFRWRDKHYATLIKPPSGV